MKRLILLLLTLFLISCGEVPHKGEKVADTKPNCDCPKIKTEKEEPPKIPDYGQIGRAHV